MGRYQEYVTRKTGQYGDKFDARDLAQQFVHWFETGARIKVRTTYGDEVRERTGTVGVTTGWRPSFLLIHRSSDTGSSDLLGAGDEIVAVWDGRRYVPLAD